MNNQISNIPCMILCGGKGTRLRDVTESLPKPMVPIGEFPIVVHIMRWYAKFGIRRFILCLGYKKEAFIDYFSNYLNNINDITIDLKNNKIIRHSDVELDWEITLADTGIETKTGLRVNKACRYLKSNDDMFFLTYGDGVSDVDISKLFKNHIEHGKLITLTAVKNPSRFGLINFNEDDTIASFDEKVSSDGYINGGFMVVSRKFINEYIRGLDVFLEQKPLADAITAREVYAYKHNGFWQCMDNAKEYELLNSMWNNCKAPWKA